MAGRVYISSLFDQSGDSYAAIQERGAAAWLEEIAGAIDLREGEESESPPWGRSDSCVHREELDGGAVLFCHVHHGIQYASVTLRLEN